MSASLGGLLKDYRLQKNLSQLEIAFALGWKDTSRLSRIEQGRIDKPQRNLMDKICQIMELTKKEANHILLTGGYLPTDEEIQDTNAILAKFIEKWPYPAAVRDFAWRVISVNSKLTKYYDIDNKTLEYLNKAYPSIIEVTLHANFKLNKDCAKNNNLNERKIFIVKMLRAFKYAQRGRTKEKWYVELMKKMMGNKLFRELWQHTVESDPELDFIANFAQKTSIDPSNNKELKVNMFIVPYLQDPRFEIEFYSPADLATFKYFDR
jgi:transcriptional regulator with XRE-family HTH domain